MKSGAFTRKGLIVMRRIRWLLLFFPIAVVAELLHLGDMIVLSLRL